MGGLFFFHLSRTSVNVKKYQQKRVFWNGGHGPEILDNLQRKRVNLWPGTQLFLGGGRIWFFFFSFFYGLPFLVACVAAGGEDESKPRTKDESAEGLLLGSFLLMWFPISLGKDRSRPSDPTRFPVMGPTGVSRPQ